MPTTPRITHILAVTAFILLSWQTVYAAADSMDDQVLLRIDGTPYRAAEYTVWRRHGAEDGAPDLDRFVDWCLLVREAGVMELDSTPEFKRKLRVFLEARALMQLKHDEVDSRIAIDKAEIRRRYNQQYVPLRLVVLLTGEQRDLEDFAARQQGKEIDAATLKELAPGTVTVSEPQWLRPVTTPAGWRRRLDGLGAGDFSRPFAMDGASAMLFVAAGRDGSEDDFRRKESAIANALRRERERELTQRLLRRLREKYQVWIDHDLIKSLAIDETARDVLGKPVIRTSKTTITAGYFLEQCRRQRRIGKGRGPEKNDAALKNMVLDAMLANGLTSYEALDRHYERRPPLREIYQFYRKNILAGLLRKRLTGEIAPVEEDEARRYYQEHTERFVRPAAYRLVLVKDDADRIQRIWTKVISGMDLADAVSAAGGRLEFSGRHFVPAGHLTARDREVVARLRAGDISGPYDSGKQRAIARVLDKKTSAPTPFARVVDDIRRELLVRRKEAVVSAFVAKLRRAAEISVNERLWERLAGARGDDQKD